MIRSRKKIKIIICPETLIKRELQICNIFIKPALIKLWQKTCIEPCNQLQVVEL